MKTSVKWLKNYINIDSTAEKLASDLTLAGLEVEGIEKIGDVPETIIVGQIISRIPHPNADKLSVCQVNIGNDKEPLQIVCGAPNCDQGNKVPLATIGTNFVKAGFKIKKSKMRGVESFGMLCSAVELGLGSDNSGLLILPENSPTGEPINSILNKNDAVIDWEVTPNRPDWFSHIGIAREIAAVNKQGIKKIKMPETKYQTNKTKNINELISIEVKSAELCPRYTARIIKNIKIAPSPQWMQEALQAVGIRPINNAVDITNYVLMECGQPLHAFDYDLLAEHKIIVRQANQDEQITTLDGKTHKLDQNTLLIADAKKAIALAGIMGGENSEISQKTTTILLESAAFNSSNIRSTAKKLAQHSDSSHRFERGIDIEMVEFASRRAVSLLCQYANGEAVDGSIDFYPTPYKQYQVTARFSRINQLIGIKIPKEFIRKTYNDLALTVTSEDKDTITVSVPSFRQDITREADLIEEIARIYGLDNIPESPALSQLGGYIQDDTYYIQETTCNQLLGLGFTETKTYSLCSEKQATFHTGIQEQSIIKLSNPLSIEAACMRPTLIPGLIQSVANNIAHGNHHLQLFELGKVATANQQFPEERLQIALALTGCPHPERFGKEAKQQYDFYDLKGTIQSWLENNRIFNYECQPTQHPTYKTGNCAKITINNKTIAIFGEAIHPLSKEMRLKHPLFLATIELDIIKKIKTKKQKYTPLPQYPATTRDISLIAEQNLQSQTIITTILAAKCKILESVQLFDIFADDKLKQANKHSLAYTLTYRDPNKTLTDKKVNKSHEKIRSYLQKKLPIELR